MSKITITRTSSRGTALITFMNSTSIVTIRLGLYAKPIRLSQSTLLILRGDGTYNVYTHTHNGLVVAKGFKVVDGIFRGCTKDHERYEVALTAFYVANDHLF